MDTFGLTDLEKAKAKAASSEVTGPGQWGFIHIHGLHVDQHPEDFHHFQHNIGIIADYYKSEHCRQEFANAMDANPVKPGQAFLWSVEMHNNVNRRQGRTPIGLEEAYRIWGPENTLIVPCRDQQQGPAMIQTPWSKVTANPYHVGHWMALWKS